MLMQVQARDLALSRETQVGHTLNNRKDDERDSKSCDCGCAAADGLCYHLTEAAAIEQSGDNCRRVNASSCRNAELARCEQAQRKRSPDTGNHVNRYRANWVVDAKVFQQIDPPDYDQPAADADKECANRVHPI